MFVRKKKHRSGHIGVLVVDKSNGKFREIKNFGVLLTPAQHSIKPLFDILKILDGGKSGDSASEK